MEQNRAFYRNPKIDYLFGYFGKVPVPTKQDKFKPIDIIEIYENENEKIIKGFYIKKSDQEAVVNFCNTIRNIAVKYFSDENIIK